MGRAVLEVIEQEKLQENSLKQGTRIKDGLERLCKVVHRVIERHYVPTDDIDAMMASFIQHAMVAYLAGEDFSGLREVLEAA